MWARRLLTPAFTVQLSPSRLWLSWAVVLMFVGGGAVIAAGTIWLLPLLLWPLLWQVLTYDGWLGHRRRVKRIDVLGEVFTLHYGPSSVRAVLCGDSIAWPWLIILNFRVHTRRVSVTLWPDSAPADVLRQLRVYLRWYAVYHKDKRLLNGKA